MNKKTKFTSTNNIDMVCTGKYCWELAKEYPNKGGSTVYKLIAGDIANEKMLVILYGVDVQTLSIRTLNCFHYGEGDTFYFKMNEDKIEDFVTSLINGNKLNLLPLYDSNFITEKQYEYTL